MMFSATELVDLALSKLSTRERQVLAYRFGMGSEPRTLEEVGRDFGVTRERIRKIETKALRILRTSRKCNRLLLDATLAGKEEILSSLVHDGVVYGAGGWKDIVPGHLVLAVTVAYGGIEGFLP